MITKERGDTIFSDNKPTFTAKPRNHSRFYSSPFANPPLNNTPAARPSSLRPHLGRSTSYATSRPSQQLPPPLCPFSFSFFSLSLIFVFYREGSRHGTTPPPWSSPLLRPSTSPPASCSSASIRPTSRCLMPRVLSGGGPERSARSDRADGRRRVGGVEAEVGERRAAFTFSSSAAALETKRIRYTEGKEHCGLNIPNDRLVL